MSELRFRSATENDIDLIVTYIKRIAEYEKMSDSVHTNPNDVKKWMFDEKITHCDFLQVNDQVIGFVLYFYNYSTFTGKAGLYVEDLFIDPQYRKNGYGKQTFIHLAKKAIEKDCGRMEWVCLKWNEPSIAFYKKLGAFTMDEWHTFRLNREGIENVASM